MARGYRNKDGSKLQPPITKRPERLGTGMLYQWEWDEWSRPYLAELSDEPHGENIVCEHGKQDEAP